jgi:hypothetical protein
MVVAKVVSLQPAIWTSCVKLKVRKLQKRTMKKLFTIVLLLVTLTMQAQQKEISYIETTKNWYYIYDESGKKIKTLYRSGIGDIKGWGKDFFVTKRGAFYLICDAEGKTLKTLGAQSVGEIISVSSSTFTSRLGVWIYTWNKEGKKIQTRGASK